MSPRPASARERDGRNKSERDEMRITASFGDLFFNELGFRPNYSTVKSSTFERKFKRRNNNNNNYY